MNADDNKALIRGFYDRYPHDLSQVGNIFSADYSHAPGVSPGPHGVEERSRLALEKFGEEMTVTLHNVISEGDLVVAEVTFTGRCPALRQINWYRVRDGQIIERWWVEGQSDFEPVRATMADVDPATAALNKTIVRRYYEETMGNPNVADELFGSEHVHYPGLTPGPDGVKELMAMVVDRFGGDASVGLEHLVADRELVAADFTLSGEGNYTREMCLFRVLEGKIVSRSCVYCDPPPGSKFCY